jgi:type II secretory ATPase GspE/PulE/Tfp pilus assembly ATPase PilB-like protein
MIVSQKNDWLDENRFYGQQLTLWDQALLKVEQGITSLTEVQRVF